MGMDRGCVVGIALLLAISINAYGEEPPSRQPLGKIVYVESQDEFAEINTQATKGMLQLLRSSDEGVRDKALQQAIARPNHYAPPVLFEISKALYRTTSRKKLPTGMSLHGFARLTTVPSCWMKQQRLVCWSWCRHSTRASQTMRPSIWTSCGHR